MTTAHLVAEPAPHTPLHVLAHDVRSPLHTIMMAADLIDLRADATADVRRFLDIIRAAVHQIDTIVEDVLVSSGGAGEPPRQRRGVDARSLLVEAAEQHEDMAELKGVRLTVDAPRAPTRAAIAREPMLRAIANLLSNAIRCTPAGGSVRLTAEPVGADVAFRVADTGCGMDPVRLESLMQKAIGSEARPGLTGNGLVIAQQIVGAAGGRMSASTEPGVGSTFTLSVPLWIPVTEDPPPPRAVRRRQAR